MRDGDNDNNNYYNNHNNNILCTGLSHTIFVGDCTRSGRFSIMTLLVDPADPPCVYETQICLCGCCFESRDARASSRA